MGCVIRQKIKCGNQVKMEHGSVLCGIYQIEDGIKSTWFCDECSPIVEEVKKDGC